MIELHCSSLPRVLACPAALRDPAIGIRSDSERSRVGRAVHELLADMLRQDTETRLGPIPDPWPYAARHEVSADEVEYLGWRGWRIWEQVRPTLEVIAIEEPCALDITADVRLVGTADLLARVVDDSVLNAGMPVVNDWKSGWKQLGAWDQLLGYALLAHERLGYPPMVKVMLSWLRYDFQVLDIQASTLDELRRRIIWAAEHPNIYNPSEETCGDCKRGHECPAREALVRSSITALQRVDAAPPADPRQIAALHDKAKMLEKMLDRFYVAEKATVKEHGGVLDMGDGRELVLTEVDRGDIDLAAGVSALCAAFGCDLPELVDKLTAAISVSKSELMSLLTSDLKPRSREKGKRRKALLDSLEAAGAIVHSTQERLVPRKKEEVSDGN